MSRNLYDALADCLDGLQRGEDLESCLARYPELVNELRPLLTAAAQAASLAVAAAPAEAARRGKSRLMNAAAELRERDMSGSRRGAGPAAFPRFRRSFLLAFSTIAAAVVILLLLSSAGLVYASSSSLPGDRLYRVKLSWEDLRLQLAGAQKREALQDHFQQERRDEVDELLAKGRAEKVEFIGLVSSLLPDRLVVTDLTVFLTDQTQVEGNLAVGARVKVEGLTQADGTVVGTDIKVLGPEGEDHGGGGGSDDGLGDQTPTPRDSGHDDDDDSGNQTPTPGDSEHDGDDDSQDRTPTPEDNSGGSTPQVQSFDIEGTISRLNNGSIVVGGVLIVLDNSTEIRGDLAEGAVVRARGFISSNGTYLATRVEVQSSDGGHNSPTVTPTPLSGGGGGGGGGGGDGGGGGGDGGGDGDDHGGSGSPTPTRTPEH